MKIAALSQSDIHGGAAKAAYRIHHALRSCNVDSCLYAVNANSMDWTVKGPANKYSKAVNQFKSIAGRAVTKLTKTENHVLHSPAFMPSSWSKLLNISQNDIVHLHWVNDEMMSISDIGQIRKPVVWTLHDMWAFCGAEHYTEDHRWKAGYMNNNRPDYESGFDLNKWVWNRKMRHWKRPMHIVTPSHWLAECVKDSRLMHDWPVTVIHNAIDTDSWRPVDRVLARQLFGLPGDVPLVLFGAMGGGRDDRKGFNLLNDSLRMLSHKGGELHLVVFGQLSPEMPDKQGYPIHYVGHLHDDISLRLLYSAADMLVIPSRQDNLPNTGVEALACGTPVVAFNIGGLPDIVDHMHNGYLAKAFDSEDMADGINWILSDESRLEGLRINARNKALTRFSYEIVGKHYSDIYQSVV